MNEVAIKSSRPVPDKIPRKSAGKYIHENFPVLEMTCASCAVSVESMLKSTAGVKDAGVNFANQTAWV